MRIALFAVTAAAVMASAAQAQTFNECEQSVAYKIDAPAADVPANAKPFSGVWAGKWESRICSALIVESIQPDGTARIVYIHGSVGGNPPLKAGYSRLVGKIAGNKLTAKGQTVAYEYILRGPAELTGSHTAHWGTLNGSFARQ